MYKICCLRMQNFFNKFSGDELKPFYRISTIYKKITLPLTLRFEQVICKQNFFKYPIWTEAICGISMNGRRPSMRPLKKPLKVLFWCAKFQIKIAYFIRNTWEIYTHIFYILDWVVQTSNIRTIIFLQYFYEMSGLDPIGYTFRD